MGMSAMFSGAAYYPFASAATVKLNPDGTITLFTGAVEFGQGSDTTTSQIAAEELGVAPRGPLALKRLEKAPVLR